MNSEQIKELSEAAKKVLELLREVIDAVADLAVKLAGDSPEGVLGWLQEGAA